MPTVMTLAVSDSYYIVTTVSDSSILHLGSLASENIVSLYCIFRFTLLNENLIALDVTKW
jgi:hypothetical protein